MYDRILIIGLNPAIDKTMIFNEFIPGKTNLIKNTFVKPGGKATNVAIALKNLGIDFSVAGIIAGKNGDFIKRELELGGIKTFFYSVRGETRTNYKIYSQKTKVTTEMNDPGDCISENEVENFFKFITEKIKENDLIVLSGSIPPGFPQYTYEKLINIANNSSAKVILDTNGQNLRESMKSRPYAIKPNKDELEEYLGNKLDSFEEIADEAEEIINKGTTLFFVSLGKDGAIGADNKGVTYAKTFDIIPRSTVGAGDSMVAALVYCLVNEMNIEDTLRWMVSFSTLTAELEAGEYATKEKALEVLEKIKIKKIR
jgi:1-phosphofructokinase